MTATTTPRGFGGYVYDGKQCRGFVISRGKLGREAFTREEISLGIFKTAAAAANGVFAATANEEGTE